MAKHEKLKLELGESTKLSAKDAIKSDENRLSKDAPGKWGSTSSAVVIKSDDLTKDTVEVVAASIGKALVYYRQDTQLTTEETLSTSLGAGAPDAKRALDDKFAVGFEVEVVAKAEAKKPAAPTTKSAAAAAAVGNRPPLDSSKKFSNRLPMDEPQDEPSEKTPYGMDQLNRPVAPTPGMVNPNDDSSVARASSETSESEKPSETSAASKKAATKKASKKR